MKKLHYKLTIILLGFALFLVLLNLVAVNWSLDQSFKRYVKQQRYIQVMHVAHALSELYVYEYQWEQIVHDPRAWSRWLRRQQGVFAIKKELERRQKRAEGEYRDNKQKVDPYQNLDFDRHYQMLNQMVFLMDTKKHFYHIFDKQKPRDLDMVPIMVNGVQVAYLGYTLDNEALNPMDQLFIRRQLFASIVTLALGSLLSLLVAYLLAKRLIKPIRAVSTSLNEISKRNYKHETRVSGTGVLAKLGADVNDLARTLDEQSQSQQRWMGDIAHELRTPLAVLKAQLEALEDGVRAFDEEQLHLLVKETEHLQSIVEDMRTLNQSEIGSLSYEWAALKFNEFIEESHSVWKQRLNDEDIAFSYKVRGNPYAIKADENRISQLFYNLLQNTIRYTHKPGEAKLICHFKNNGVDVTWEDSSPGVDSKNLPLIFNRLFREDKSRTRASGGTGIGLAICNNITQAHQGNITASHSALGGLKITMHFPRIK